MHFHLHPGDQLSPRSQSLATSSFSQWDTLHLLENSNKFLWKLPDSTYSGESDTPPHTLPGHSTPCSFRSTALSLWRTGHAYCLIELLLLFAPL